MRGQVSRDRLGLRGRHDGVVESLQQQHRAGAVVHVPDRRPLGVEGLALWQRADQPVQVPRLEVVRVLRERPQVGHAEVRRHRREDAIPRPVRLAGPAEHPDAGRDGGQRGPAAGRAAADPEPLPVRLARLGQGQRGRHRVGHVHDAPLAAQPLAVGAAVPARPSVVHVDDADAAAGEEGLLQVEPGDRLGGGAAVHPDDVRRVLALRAPDRGVGRRVDEGVHDRARRAGQLGRPRYRQVGGIGQRAGAAAQLAGHRGPVDRRVARGGNVHADHGGRHRRPARDGDDGLAGRRQAEDVHPVGKVQVVQRPVSGSSTPSQASPVPWVTARRPSPSTAYGLRPSCHGGAANSSGRGHSSLAVPSRPARYRFHHPERSEITYRLCVVPPRRGEHGLGDAPP